MKQTSGIGGTRKLKRSQGAFVDINGGGVAMHVRARMRDLLPSTAAAPAQRAAFREVLDAMLPPSML